MLNRRHLLRSSSVALALPLLEAMQPSVVRAGFVQQKAPRRMFCINTNMGLMPDFFWPKKADGRLESDYLSVVHSHRENLTVLDGVSHPEVDGGHHAEISFLTAAPHPAAGGFRNSISLDQYAAERVGSETRFPYLTLNVGAENASLSWTSSGARIPAETKPSAVFRKMFVQGNQQQVQQQIADLRDGRSILDVVAGRAKQLGRKVGSNDRRKLDQYFSSVRELERKLVKAEEWERLPKPVIDQSSPEDIENKAELVGRTRLMQQMAQLALQTDSTRIVALTIDQNANPKVNLPGVSEGHHSLTHHGHREQSVEQLKKIETAQMKMFAELLDGLAGFQENGSKLLDQTIVLFGSNLGNANSHDNRNMPMIIAGGGFRHRQHLQFDRKHNYPLPNLFVSMLQRMGIESDSFASSTGSMTGLEFV